jgi:hypothetical protein
MENDTNAWHSQYEFILKQWGEMCSSYSWLHDRAHRKYKLLNIYVQAPVIVLNTAAAIASFVNNSYTDKTREYVSYAVGVMNILAGSVTAISQYLKLGEIMENHRKSSIAYGSLCKNIKTELSLPISERTHTGRELVKICRSEIDKLVDQARDIPLSIIQDFEKEFGSINIYKPEIIEIQEVTVYHENNQESSFPSPTPIHTTARILCARARSHDDTSPY